MSQVEIVPNMFPYLVLGMVMLGVLTISSVLWLNTLRRVIGGRPAFPTPEFRRRQPWGAFDVGVAVVLFLALQLFGAASGSLLDMQTTTAEGERAGLVFHGWISLICCYAVILSTFGVMLRCRVGVDDVGWSFHRFGSDIRLGLSAFFMTIPPIWVLMLAATKLSGVAYEHPVMEEAKRDASLLFPAMIMAVICAPLTEEYGFRVLLQGFLEGISKGRLTLAKFIFGASVDSEPDLSAPVERQNDVPWWPTILSGVLFGLAHFSYGVSWVPLVVFGIVLGALYRHTNRILPCLVVHACFNGLTMFIFAMHVVYELPMPQ